jgi:hypothetical protein
MAKPTGTGRESSRREIPEEDDMITIRTIATGAIATAALVAPLAPAVSAHASGGTSGVTKTGSCSGSAVWKLKAKHDDTGRIEVEWQVDSNKVGQTWTVRLRDNGTLFFSGSRTTKAPSGSFSVTKFTANRAGSDTIRARSVHGSQACTASVTV